MPSMFDDQYSALHELLTALKPKFDEIDSAIDSLSSIPHEEITQLVTTTSSALREAQIRLADYGEIVDNVKKSISTMEDPAKAKEEGEQLDQKMRSANGLTGLPMNIVSLSSLMSKKEKLFTVMAESAIREAHLLSSLSKKLIEKDQVSPPDKVQPHQSQPPTPPLPLASQPLNQSSPLPPNALPPTITPTAVSTDVPAHADSTLIGQLSNAISLLANQISNPALTSRPNIALPPVTLETFDGNDITRWPAYKYQIDQLILSQPHLTEVEKAFHVRSSLKGAAHNLVATIPVHENFLQKIITRLESQYGRHNLSQAKLIQSLRSIRSKSHQVTDQLAAAQSMINIAHAIHGEWGVDALCMQQQVAECINPRFITLIARHKPKSLLAGLELIENELLVEMEDALTISAYSTLPQSSSPTSMPNSETLPTHSANPSKKPMCIFCGQHEYSVQCTQVVSIKDRKQILTTQSLCHCCFSPKHPTSDCKRQCSACGAKHHKALCEKSTTLFGGVATTTVDHLTQFKSRLFTAPVTLVNTKARQCTMANALLDCGAQMSLISRKLANQLHLTTVGQLLVSISGLAGAHDTRDPPSNHDVVQFELVTNKGKETIQAIVRDAIMHPIEHRPLSTQDQTVIKSTLGTIPRHLSLTTVQPELLLGVDHFLTLTESTQSIVLPSGYRLIQSHIGPIVAGSDCIHASPPTSCDKALSHHSELLTPAVNIASVVTASAENTPVIPPSLISNPLSPPQSSSFTITQPSHDISPPRLSSPTLGHTAEPPNHITSRPVESFSTMKSLSIDPCNQSSTLTSSGDIHHQSSSHPHHPDDAHSPNACSTAAIKDPPWRQFNYSMMSPIHPID